MRGLLYWQSAFAPGTARAYVAVTKYAWIVMVVLMLWMLYDHVDVVGTAFTSGAAAMGLFMATLWSLEIAHGSLYYWIGMATALFMAGTACGAAVMAVPRFRMSLTRTEALFTAWSAAGFLLIAHQLPVAGFALFAAGTGFVLGYQFPLLARRAGVAAYTADALGAGVAALVFGTVIIPAWGVANALLVIIALKLVTFQWWLTE
jgi:hypothetical protein